MKHVFIVNPAAGKGKEAEPLCRSITSECTRLGKEFIIHKTKAVGEAIEYIKKASMPGGECYGSRCRFYACGGDGTLSEVLNGAADIPDSEVGIIPIGTGNDFCRNCSPRDLFFNIEAQVNGKAVSIDAVKYNNKYSANMINIGFDCEVVKEVMRIKKSPVVPGNLAYIFGLIHMLVKKPGAHFYFSADGGKRTEESLLLCAIANGPYCGGGFDALPMARLTDGRINIVKVKNVSRMKFLSLVKYYKNGTLPERKESADCCEYLDCTHAIFEFDRKQAVCIDGEIEEYDRLEIKAVSDKFLFSIPEGASLGKAFYRESAETVTV